MKIDGKKMAERIYSQLEIDVKNSRKKPVLAAVLVWDNAGSLRYIGQKKKFAQQVGIDFKLIQLKYNTTQIELENKVKELNNDNNIDGYIVQLPLPNQIDSKKIIELIDPTKDVDGFHPVNVWKVLIWDSTGFIPCTPAGVMHMFAELETPLIWKKVTIVWRSNIVWKPLAALLINHGATVTVCNSHTPDIKKYTTDSDVVIMATGQKHLLHVDMVKIGTTVIDVGFSVENGKIYGDADYEILEKVGNIITPVPGWVGPLTVAMLMKNTVKAAQNK